MHDTMLDALDQRLRAQPDDPVFAFLSEEEEETDRLTFAQLVNLSRGLAAQLRELVEPQSRVVLLYSPGLDFIVSFFACLNAGLVAVPLSPPRRRDLQHKLLGVLNDCGASLVLTDKLCWDQFGEELSALARESGIRCLTRSTEDRAGLLADAARWVAPEVDGSTTAFLQYTSGSTGFPKGVCVTHRNLVYNSEMTNVAFGHTRATTMVGWLPLFHDMGLVGYVMQPVYNGFLSALMSPATFLQRPSRWLRAISRYRGTTAGGPDFAYALCVQKFKPEHFDGVDLSSWAVAFNGAEPVRPETLERFAATFAPYGFKAEALHPCYGMAESTLIASGGGLRERPTLRSFGAQALEGGRAVPLCTGQVAPAPLEQAAPAAGSRILASCGRQIKEDIIRVVDPDTTLRCPDGQVGEIWIQGAHVAAGYWNKPELSDQVFQARIAGDGEGPFLRSGDLGFMLDDHLYITGRIKDLIIIAGRNLYPQDIEAAIQASHAAFQLGGSAAFCADLQGAERLVAVQELRRDHQKRANLVELVQSARQAVARAFDVTLFDIVFLQQAALPKTSSGKVQRRRCRELYLKNELRRAADHSATGPTSQPMR